MELMLGRPAAAAAVLDQVLAACQGHLGTMSLLRLHTQRMQAALECGSRAAIARERSRLVALLNQGGGESHYLKGFACLALARAAAGVKRFAGAGRWLAQCRRHFTLPTTWPCWSYAPVRPGRPMDATWIVRMNRIFRQIGRVVETKILMWLALAEQARSAGGDDRVHECLDTAFDRAASSNNQFLVAHVELAYARLDPDGLSRRMVERFAGQPAERT